MSIFCRAQSLILRNVSVVPVSYLSISRKFRLLKIYFSISLKIAVQPPRQQVTHLNKKPVLQQGPPTEDEIRKWTEKKRRSKSLPRGGSEIDEILGK